MFLLSTGLDFFLHQVWWFLDMSFLPAEKYSWFQVKSLIVFFPFPFLFLSSFLSFFSPPRITLMANVFVSRPFNSAEGCYSVAEYKGYIESETNWGNYNFQPLMSLGWVSMPVCIFHGAHCSPEVTCTLHTSPAHWRPHGTGGPEMQRREDLTVLNNSLGFPLNPESKQGLRVKCALQIQVQKEFPFLYASSSMWIHHTFFLLY